MCTWVLSTSYELVQQIRACASLPGAKNINKQTRVHRRPMDEGGRELDVHARRPPLASVDRSLPTPPGVVSRAEAPSLPAHAVRCRR